MNTPFALAVWDSRDGTLLLCGDRYGNQPIYYGLEGTRFAFSTRASTVAALLGTRPKLDRATLGELIWFGHPVGERTLFEGVNRLLPATWLEVKNGRTVLRSYWHPRFGRAGDQQVSLEDACAAFRQAVERETEDDDVALALTGGQDTRAILAAALSLGRGVHGFSAGVRGSWDLVVARRLGKHLGSRFRSLTLDDRFEPLYPALARDLVFLAEGALGLEHAHNIALHQYCSGRFTSLVDGGGARVCKRGFLRRAALGLRRKSEAAGLIAGRYGRPGLAGTLLQGPGARELASAVRAEVRRLVRDSEQDDLAGTLDAYFLRVNWANFYARAAAMQSHFIEGRLPFLDYHFLDTAIKLPPALRGRSAVQCETVARMAPTLRKYGRVFCDAYMPWTENGLVKYGFAGVARAMTLTCTPFRWQRPCFPFGSWWRNGLCETMADGLGTLAERGVFEADRVVAVARGCRLRDARFLPAAELLWRVELWHEMFVDCRRDAAGPSWACADVSAPTGCVPKGFE